MSLYEELMKEAELELNKVANEANGAPEQAQNTGQTDITQTAQDFLAKIEQFKQQLNGALAQGGQQTQQVANPDQQANPEGQVQVDENGQPITGQAQPINSGVTIQTPGGTILKLASLVKLAAFRPSILEEI